MRAQLGIVLALSGCCEDGFIGPREIAIDPHGALRGIATGDGRAYYIIDSGGHVSILDEVRINRRYKLKVVDEVQVSSSPLVAIAVANFYDDSILVVDEAGVVFQSRDDGRTWDSNPLDAGLEPRGILFREATDGATDVVVYGEGFVRMRSIQGDEWKEPEAPDDDWGSLRVHTSFPYELLLSDGADLLIADDPEQLWQRVDAPTQVLALGSSWSGDLGTYIIGGPDGILMTTTIDEVRDVVTWTRIHEGLTDANVVAISERWVLTDAAEIINLDTAEKLDVGAAGAGFATNYDEMVAFGANGPVLLARWNECEVYH